MTNRFKVGDKVRCINPHVPLEAGKEYIVEGIDSERSGLLCINGEWWCSTRFQKCHTTLIEAAEDLCNAIRDLGHNLASTITIWGIILTYILATSIYFGTITIPQVYNAGYKAHYGIEPDTPVTFQCSRFTTLYGNVAEFIDMMEVK